MDCKDGQVNGSRPLALQQRKPDVQTCCSNVVVRSTVSCHAKLSTYLQSLMRKVQTLKSIHSIEVTLFVAVGGRLAAVAAYYKLFGWKAEVAG